MLWRLCCVLVVLGVMGFADRPAFAQAPAEPEKITYTDHILPLVRRRCGSCHNSTDRKGGLALDSYASVITGGSSGAAVTGGDPDSSYLWGLVNRTSEPAMPPMADKLPDSELALIRAWIEQGLRENSGSEAKLQKRSDIGAVQVSGQKPEHVAFPKTYLGVAPKVTARANAVTALAVSPWAPLLAVSGPQQIALYHTQTRELLGVLPFPEGQAQVLKFSRDGSLLLAGGGRGGAEGKVVLFDVTTGQRKAEIGQEYDAVLAADISPDHELVALGGPKKIVRVFSTATGEVVHEINKHTDWVTAIEFSPDGVLLATGDRSNGLQLWETKSGRPFLDLTGHKGAITALSWRADSNLLASASEDGTWKLWELNDGKTVRSVNAHGGALALVFTRDGRLLTTGRDRVARLWDAEGKQQREFGPLGDLGLEVAFDNESNIAIAGDWSGRVQLWNIAENKDAGRLSTNPPPLTDVIAAVEQQLAATDNPPAENPTAEVGALRARATALKALLPAAQP